jgi:hypothetical protein
MVCARPALQGREDKAIFSGCYGSRESLLAFALAVNPVNQNCPVPIFEVILINF